MKRTSKEDRIFYAVNTVIMAFMVVVCVYPILYVVFASFSDPSRIMAHSGMLWHSLGFNTAAYKEVLHNKMLLITYRNTIFYLIAGTAINMIMSICGAYVLSRDDVKIKKVINIMVVITMFFSGGIIPLYLTVRSYHMLNTVWALMIPQAINTWNLIVMRTSFQAVPKSLEESAIIDGAGEFVIMTRIILPLSKAILAVMALFYGVGMWNAWFQASMFLRNRELYPLQLFLREVLINSSTDSMMTGSASAASDRAAISETIKYATIVVSTLPILCAYPFLQKYFVKGVMVGALKG